MKLSKGYGFGFNCCDDGDGMDYFCGNGDDFGYSLGSGYGLGDGCVYGYYYGDGFEYYPDNLIIRNLK